MVDVSGLSGVTVTWITDDTHKAALGRLMIDAATAITQDEPQSVESFAWFRGTDAEVEQQRDGLTLDGQGLSPLVLSIAKLLPASSRGYGDRFWVTQTRDVHTRTAAAYGVVTVADPHDAATQLNGGRLLQRVHLLATTHGIALHHMNQVTERIDREQTTGAPAATAPRLSAILPDGAQALVTFRVGYGERAARRSPRRALADVTR